MPQDILEEKFRSKERKIRTGRMFETFIVLASLLLVLPGYFRDTLAASSPSPSPLLPISYLDDVKSLGLECLVSDDDIAVGRFLGRMRENEDSDWKMPAPIADGIYLTYMIGKSPFPCKEPGGKSFIGVAAFSPVGPDGEEGEWGYAFFRIEDSDKAMKFQEEEAALQDDKEGSRRVMRVKIRGRFIKWVKVLEHDGTERTIYEE